MSPGSWLTGVLLGRGGRSLEGLGVQELTTLDGLTSALEAEGPLLIFKHSTTCPISASAYRRVAAWAAEHGGDGVPLYLIKVIESRPVSNAVAERLGVRHESPQMLLVRGGACVWHASHGAIDGAAITRALGQA